MADYDMKAILGEKIKRLTDKTLKAIVDCMCTVGAALCSLDKRVSALESVELPEGGYKPMQEPMASPSASGTAIQFIDSMSQDATGRITATKKTVRTGNWAYAGVVILSDSTSSTSGVSDGVAATPTAVKAAYDLASGKQEKMYVRIVYNSTPFDDVWQICQDGFTPVFYKDSLLFVASTFGTSTTTPYRFVRFSCIGAFDDYIDVHSLEFLKYSTGSQNEVWKQQQTRQYYPGIHTFYQDSDARKAVFRHAEAIYSITATPQFGWCVVYNETDNTTKLDVGAFAGGIEKVVDKCFNYTDRITLFITNTNSPNYFELGNIYCRKFSITFVNVSGSSFSVRFCKKQDSPIDEFEAYTNKGKKHPTVNYFQVDIPVNSAVTVDVMISSYYYEISDGDIYCILRIDDIPQ